MKPGGGAPPGSRCGWIEPPLSFEDLLNRNTGWVHSTEQWQEQRSRRQALEAETARIADALEAEGIRVRLETGGVLALGSVTGILQPVESYRAIRFLPVVAQRERRPMLNALGYYQRGNPFGSYLRFAVVTSGQRVPLWGDLRGRIQRLHRRISRFAHEARKQFSIEVVYRGTEFTVDEVLSFHVHANVLFAPRSALPARRWEEFLRWTRRFFGAHFQDNGRLEKPREAIKYSFKPAELEWLEGPALAWVYHETRGLKLAQPLGDFAEFWRELDRRGLKVLLVDGPEGVRVRPVAKQGRPSSTRERRAGLRRDESAPENEILCQMAPQSRFSPYAEPVLLVRNYTTNPKTWEGLVRLEEINEHRRRARSRWDANGAPDPASVVATAEPQRSHSGVRPQVSGSAQSSSEKGLRSRFAGGAGDEFSVAAGRAAGAPDPALSARGVSSLASSPRIPPGAVGGRGAPGMADPSGLAGLGLGAASGRHAGGRVAVLGRASATGGDGLGAPAAGPGSEAPPASAPCSGDEEGGSSRSSSAMARMRPGRMTK